MTTRTIDTSSHIAIVGMSCRFPGAESPEQYWQNLLDGKESRRSVSPQDLAEAGLDPAVANDPHHVAQAFTLDQVDGFDASFFYIGAREAEKMDPQLRVFLETAWHALEHAGYNSEKNGGDIGVYAAGLGNTYLAANLLTSRAHYHGDVSAMLGDLVARIGNDVNYLATRTSYHLNLTGPSISVQTACSSSLVAVHQAIESLLAGECDTALAGGVSIRFPRLAGYLHQPDGILSHDGHCRPFDAEASGTVFGDGAGIVVLKRLDDALADGDTIHAVVLGSAIGNDGADKVGFAAPSVSGQVKVVEQALQVAGVDKASIGYIEAHGTGTPMGDPIEVQALNTVFSNQQAGHRIALGSVKGNIGHLSIASGVAGLIKTVLMLKHRTLVPTAHYRAPNPECFMEKTPFWVPQAVQSWEAAGAPLRAGVSSIGMGGTNCHLVLERAADPGPDMPQRPLSLMVLSAKSPEALQTAVRNATAYLATGQAALADVAHTYATGRRTFNYRQAVVAQDAAEAQAIWSGVVAGQVISGHSQPAPQPVVFMFPGQGSQYTAMAQGCYDHEPAFRAVVDECSALLMPMLGFDLRSVIFPSLFPSSLAATALNETQTTQPALFVIEYALARLWMSWGITPTAFIGHSIGEYVAACLAGVFDLPSALHLIAMRGKLVQALPAGAMAAVPLSHGALLARLPEGICIAATNETAACTVSGSTDAITRFIASLASDGIIARKLNTSHAFHSAMMDPACEPLRQAVGTMALAAPRIPIVSNLTGTWLTDELATSPAYWADHLRHTVKFAEGTEFLLRQNAQQIFLEVGPSQTLASFVRRHPDKEVSHVVLSTLGRVKQARDEYRSLLGALARFWAAGIEVDWAAFYSGEQRRRVALPVYPFEHESFYALPSSDYRSARAADSGDHKQPLENWCYTPVWKQSISALTNDRSYPHDDSGPFLVFSDTQGVADKLVARLRAGGAAVTQLRSGAALALDGADGTLRLHVKDDYADLLRLLKEEQRLPRTVVHLCSVDAAPAQMRRDGFEHAQQLGVYSLTYLIQAFATLNITHPMRWQVATRSAYPVSGAEQLCPEQSTANVFAKVISQEYAQIDCRLLDLGYLGGADDAAAAAGALLQELAVKSEREYTVAHRYGKRWVQSMERIVQQPQWDFAALSPLAHGGVYLITGGLGEIGATLAGMLADKYGAKLALLVRELMPPLKQWDDYLATATPDDLAARRIHTVRALEARGAEVLVVQADVSSHAAMRDAMGDIIHRFGHLDGVFHAAGLPGEKWDRTLENAGIEEIRWHFQSKAYGVQVLGEVLKPHTPKFCVLISSIASMLGGLRLGPYGAANHYMDNAAVWLTQSQPHTHWVAIDWDVWQHHQDEKREHSALGKMMDARTVLPQQGMETIERVLAMRSVAQVSVSTWDMGVRARRWIQLDSTRADQAQKSQGSAEAMAGKPVNDAVLALLNQTLGRGALGFEDDFFEAGGDSLISLQLLAAVREQYGVNVSLAKFLSQPTAASLSALIEMQLKPDDDVLAVIDQHWTGDQAPILLEMIARIRALSDAQLDSALR